MLQKTINEYLSRLILDFSDLCETDKEIADCLTFMQAPTPTGVRNWNAELVRQAIPSAYSTAASASDYSTNPNNQTLKICRAIYTTVKETGRKEE